MEDRVDTTNAAGVYTDIRRNPDEITGTQIVDIIVARTIVYRT